MHRIVETEHDRTMLFRLLRDRPFPFTVEVVKGRRRSVAQNRVQRLWMNEIAEQLGDRTPEEVRGYCKLHFGVPMLRAENELFCAKYDAIVKPLPYEQKLAIMMEPLDMPVTRLMTTGQNTRYLDAIYKHFTEEGLVLTVPDPQHEDEARHRTDPDDSPSDATYPASEKAAVSVAPQSVETAATSQPASERPATHAAEVVPEDAAGEIIASPAKAVPPETAGAPAAVPPLSPADKAKVRRYAAALSDVLEERALQRGSGAFIEDHRIEEGTPIYEACRAIFTAHLARVSGKSSPVEAEQAVDQVLAA